MLFVAIGLIILFISFLIAVVSLVREFGQRVNDEEMFPLDYQGLELADEVVPVPSLDNESVQVSEEPTLPSLVNQDFDYDEPLALDETVPFPWETEGNSSSNLQASSVSNDLEAGTFEPVADFKVGGSNLYGEISIADLKQRD